MCASRLHPAASRPTHHVALHRGRRLHWAVATLLALGAASGCRFGTAAFGPPVDEPGEGGAAGGTAEGGGEIGGSGSGGDGGADVDTTKINIRFRATTEPFAHQDELAGQTPLEHYSGVRSLQLFEDESDPNPVTIFDLGEDFVEIGYNDGDDTLVASVAASSLPLGHYTLARTVHTHVRYRVGSTMHVGGLPLAGEFECMQVLSDGTLIDGQLRDHGYYEYVFTTGGQSFPTSGSTAPLPLSHETGGFTAVLEEGQWAYYYAVDLAVTPDLAEDVDVVLNVNMHGSFRWTDQQQLGYLPDVFDTTPTTFEPVIKFGANSYWMTLE